MDRHGRINIEKDEEHPICRKGLDILLNYLENDRIISAELTFWTTSNKNQGEKPCLTKKKVLLRVMTDDEHS